MELRFELGFTEHEKVELVGPLGLALYVRSIDHATLNLTDGHIDEAVVPTLLNFRGIAIESDLALPGIGETVTPELLARRLTSAGLWHETDRGYLIHDYSDFQVTRAKLFGAFDFLERRREKDRARKRGDSAEQPPRSTDSKGSSVSELAAVVQNSGELPISQNREPRDTTPFVLLAEKVKGCDNRTIPAWLSSSEGLPAEWACARALESLVKRRESGPLRSEAGYITATLKKLRVDAA